MSLYLIYSGTADICTVCSHSQDHIHLLISEAVMFMTLHWQNGRLDLDLRIVSVSSLTIFVFLLALQFAVETLYR